MENNFIKIHDDNFKLHRRIEFLIDRSVSHLAPTISPAPKYPEKKEIESLEKGLEYLFQFTDRVIMQPKYMGSYVDVYLKKNIEKSYIISKNGYNARNISDTELIDLVRPLHQKLDWEGISEYLIQAELMPWSALGKGLIEYEYRPYIEGVSGNLRALVSLDYKVDQVFFTDDYIKRDLTKAHIRRQYGGLEKLREYCRKYDLKRRGVSTFVNQLNVHGKDDTRSLKPFNILRIIKEDGEKVIVNDNLTFKQVSNDDFLIIDKDTPLNVVYTLFDKWTNDLNLEGVVIKPIKAFIENCPLGLKVRSNKFLHLLYGERFELELDTHISERSTKKKLESSIIDWQLSEQMLKEDVSEDNFRLKNLFLNRILQEQLETTIDNKL